MPLINKIVNVRMELEKLNAVREPNLAGHHLLELNARISYALRGTRTDNRGVKIAAVVSITPNGPATILRQIEATLSFTVELNECVSAEEVQEFIRNVQQLNNQFLPYIDHVFSNITSLMNFTPMIISRLIANPTTNLPQTAV